MRRVVVFLLVGPLLATAASFASMHHHGPSRSVWLFTTELFLSTSTASIFVGLFDGYLARVSPIFPRVLLTAMVGAIVTWPLANAFILSSLGGFFCSAQFSRRL